ALGRDRDRLDDLRVARAAAEVAGDRLADRIVVGRAARVDVGPRRHQHSRRADPALGATRIEERLLQRVEVRAALGAGREALDGPDQGAVDLADRDEAGIDDRVVEQDRAGAALPFPATLLRPRQPAGLAPPLQGARA